MLGELAVIAILIEESDPHKFLVALLVDDLKKVWQFLSRPDLILVVSGCPWQNIKISLVNQNVSFGRICYEFYQFPIVFGLFFNFKQLLLHNGYIIPLFVCAQGFIYQVVDLILLLLKNLNFLIDLNWFYGDIIKLLEEIKHRLLDLQAFLITCLRRRHHGL